MSKIIYLLGAGASYGIRDTQEISVPTNNLSSVKIKPILRGVPIINEFENQIYHICDKIKKDRFEHGFKNKASSETKTELITNLKWLADICKSYPTVDTYARQLYVTKKIKEYNRLKKTISIFLTLCQNPNTRDIRYDGFIASIINDNNTFPSDISILSWNYDCQFEFSYSGYMTDPNSDISKIWNHIKIFNKESDHPRQDDFSILKLNGVALYHNPRIYNYVWDVYKLENDFSLTNNISLIARKGEPNVRNSLSFAWENSEVLKSNIIDHVSDAEVLVIIGYSFPYVNRTIDRIILENMPSLSHIYIQDPNAENVKESLEAVLPFNKTESIRYSLRKNLSQFVIPNELR